MTDQPDLCCTHGEPILQRLDRLVELMQTVAETRANKPETCGARYAVKSSGSTVDHVDCPQPRPCLIHDRPRGYTLGDQFNDLVKRHEQMLVSDAQFYKILADMTGVPLPKHAQEEGWKRPEQGHIVNSPKFLAALEDFRQKYERGELEELPNHHSTNT